MKLELKHLAGYLPYGLKMYFESLDGNKKSDWILSSDTIEFALNNQNKPILRPLSYLTKEIEVNGEKFVPLIKLQSKGYNMNFDEEYTFDDFIKGDILNNSYGFIELLLEWHFDIYGLIENNLAINKNTL